MLLNEHDSKRLFRASDIPVPHGVSLTSEQVDTFEPGFPLPWFLKAQVLTGGRGKAGGIKRVDSHDELSETAHSILNMDIKGHHVPFLRVEPASDIDQEFYLSFTVSRKHRSIVLTVGREGGVEIEQLGSENLLVQHISLPGGLRAHHCRAAFFQLGLSKDLFRSFYALLTKLWNCVRTNHLLLAEINPLVLTPSGEFVALDGKVEIDDNAADLNKELDAYYRTEHFPAEENMARVAGLSFVKLNGYVGLMVNGAGLAMATMDLLNYSNLPAANFLDLGGGADLERMKSAFSLLFGDQQVQMVFINLYGGILSCKQVALAMQGALAGNSPAKPVVARFSGNESEEGLDILRGLGVQNLHLASTMSDAIDILEELRPQETEKSEYVAPKATHTGQPPAPQNTPCSRHFEITANTPILVQGITGKEGQLHTKLMQAYGANIVAGVTPFKGGQEVLGVPVYSSVAEATKSHSIGASIIFVPPAMAADAVREACASNIEWVICITEGIQQQEMMSVLTEYKDSESTILGPNTPGLILPGQTKIGILPTDPFSPGPVAVLSRSGTLTYEVAARLTQAGVGQSLSVGIGGDPFIGTNFVDMFEMLRDHEETQAIVVLGEIGGNAEEDLAKWVMETGFHKPVVSFIAGRTAPPGRRFGHAGAILETSGGIESKIGAMQNAGFTVCPDLGSIADAVKNVLK